VLQITTTEDVKLGGDNGDMVSGFAESRGEHARRSPPADETYRLPSAETLAGRDHVLAGLITQAGTDASVAPEELDPLRRIRPCPTAAGVAYQNARSPA